MSAQELIQQAINGVSLGSTYALLALGLAMVFSIMGLINFAHGELLTIGGYSMWLLLEHGVPWPAVIPVTLFTTTVAAVLMERIAFRPVRGASVTTLLVTSFAISFFLQYLFGVAISARARGISTPEWVSSVVRIGSYSVPLIQVVTCGVTLICLASLAAFLRRSRYGIEIRAAAEDFAVTRLMGVRADRVIMLAFALSGLLAGVAALLYVSRVGSVEPTTGLNPLVKAFIAVIIGGLGSLSGAVLGGFVLGFSEVVLQATLPDAALPFRDALVLTFLIALLFARPSGLVGRQTRESD